MIAAALTVMLALCTVLASAESVSITKKRVYYERSGSNKVRVSEFTVRGRPAFCIEKSKKGPKTGTLATPRVYEKHDLDKYLYYGYGGPEQWSGFSSVKTAKAVTSVILSNAHSGGKAYDWLADYSSFVSFVESRKNPDIGLTLSTRSPKTTYDSELGSQVTEYIRVSGSEKGRLSLQVPEGVVLRRSGSDETLEGRVVLKAGDIFRFETTEETVLSRRVTAKGINKCLEVTVYVTESEKVQDLAQMNIVDDLSSPISISFSWRARTGFRLRKTDDNGAAVSGCRFKLVELDPKGLLSDGSEPTAENLRDEAVEGEIITVNEKGVYESETGIPVGTHYALCELASAKGYVMSDEVKLFDTIDASRDIELEFVNLRQRARLIIKKKGEDYSISEGRIKRSETVLEGAAFEVTGPDGESLTVTTGPDGTAIADGLTPGEYVVREVSSPYGHILDDRDYEVDLSCGPNDELIEYNLNVENRKIQTRLTIIKCDKDTRERLEGAVFSVVSSDGRSIEVKSSGDGVCELVNLPEGEYAVREISPPLGYDTAEKEQMVTISLESEDAAEASLTFFDSRLASAPPKTGDSGGILLYAGLALAAAAGLAVLTVLRRCDKL